MDPGRLGRLPEVFENLSNWHRLGDKGDESYLATAVVTAQRKDLVDTGQEHGPQIAGWVGGCRLISSASRWARR
jgi:hypothetical protein